MVPTVRLFVAVRLPGGLVESVWAAAREAVAGTGIDPDAQVRWSPASQAHLTVAFCEAVEATRVPLVLGAVDALAGRTPPMVCALDGRLGHFGSPRHGRAAVWAGLGAHAGLTALAEGCADALEAVGANPARRAFHAHLTVARLRERVAPGALAAWQEAYRGPSEAFAVDRVEVVRSTTAPGGAVHETIGMSRLGG